jgi:hypothetical protein
MNMEAEGIQGAVFLAPEVRQEEAVKVWARIFPDHPGPDSTQRANPANPALHSVAAGEVEGLGVRITTQVGRIDLFLRPNVRHMALQAEPPSGPVRVADIDGFVDRMVSAMMSVSQGLQPVRLAMVLDLGQTVSHGSEADALTDLLPGLPIPKGSSDVVFQFNKRKSFSEAHPLEVNRLCTWVSGRGMLFQGIPNAGFLSAASSSTISFVNMKVDVNSVPDFRLQPGSENVVIKTLATEVVAIAHRGLERLSQ